MKRFFARVDRVLRRSLGVSETAKADDTVKPAPPVDPELPDDDDSEDLGFEAPPPPPPESKPASGKGKPMIEIPDELKEHLSIELEEILDDEPISKHDEL